MGDSHAGVELRDNAWVSRFRVCARTALGASGPRPSHAWIALLRCIEALSRLTGEPYREILARLGQRYGFGSSRSAWPDAAQIRAAAEDLVAEREVYLSEYRALVAERKARKARGDRRRGGRLAQFEARHNTHNLHQPRVGYWGWRALREGMPALSLEGLEPRHRVLGRPGAPTLIDLRSGGDPRPTRELSSWCARAFEQRGVDSWRSALLADARVWSLWCALEAEQLCRAARQLRRAGVRELWLVQVGDPSPAKTEPLRRGGLAVRVLAVPVARG